MQQTARKGLENLGIEQRTARKGLENLRQEHFKGTSIDALKEPYRCRNFETPIQTRKTPATLPKTQNSLGHRNTQVVGMSQSPGKIFEAQGFRFL